MGRLGVDPDRVDLFEMTTDSSGMATSTLQIAEDGYYTLEVTGSDEPGHLVAAEVSLYINDYTGTWRNDYAADLTIRAAKEVYLPGETARLMIDLISGGKALLTVERGRVRWHMLISLTPPATLVTLPITPDSTEYLCDGTSLGMAKHRPDHTGLRLCNHLRQPAAYGPR